MKFTKAFEAYWRRVAPTKLGDWGQFDRTALKEIAFRTWNASRRAVLKERRENMWARNKRRIDGML